jgi:hypothetical protein
MSHETMPAERVLLRLSHSGRTYDQRKDASHFPEGEKVFISQSLNRFPEEEGATLNAVVFKYRALSDTTIQVGVSNGGEGWEDKTVPLTATAGDQERVAKATFRATGGDIRVRFIWPDAQVTLLHWMPSIDVRGKAEYNQLHGA